MSLSTKHLLFCIDCPISGTDYCHILNPKAPKYNRAEKIAIREMLDAKNKENSNAD